MGRIRTARVAFAGVLATAVAAAGVARAELYQWVDENGKLHFSDVPPAGQRASEVQERREQAPPTAERATDYRGRYTGESPSRMVILEKVAWRITSPGEAPRTIGSCGRRDITSQSARGKARSISWESGFHGRLEELGYETPRTALTFAREGEKAPDVSVMGVINDLQISDCYRVERMEVAWRVFDNLRRRVVLEVTTRGSDEIGLGPAQRSLRHGMLEAFVGAAGALFRESRFGEIVAPDQPAAARAAGGDLPPLPLSVRYAAGRSTFAERVASLKRATVTVRTAGGHGSGFLISRDGHVLTNDHVVAGRDEAIVVLGEREREARVLRRDSVRDVALLQLDGLVSAAPLALARTNPGVGESLYAVGTPLDERLSHTVTRGILSAEREIEGQRFYQTDAAVNPGNSGGPVFNERGELVAIAVAGLFTQAGGSMSINLLIPIAEAFDALHLEAEAPPAGRAPRAQSPR